MDPYESVPALKDDKLSTECPDADADDQDDASGPPAVVVTSRLLVKTAMIILSYFVMGIYLVVEGPSLPDLMRNIDVNFEEISRALVIHSAGYLVSAVTGGVLTDKFPDHVELFLGVAFMLAAVGTGLAPWVTSLGALSLLLLCRGLSQGSMDVYCNFMCVRLWQHRAATPLHVLHFSFGLGAVIIPQIARPFLGQVQVQYNETQNAYVTMENFDHGGQAKRPAWLDYSLFTAASQTVSPSPIQTDRQNMSYTAADGNASSIGQVTTVASQNVSLLAEVVTAAAQKVTTYISEQPALASEQPGVEVWVSRIYIPYSMAAILAGSFSLLFFISYAYERQRSHSSLHTDASSPTKTGSQKSMVVNKGSKTIRTILSPGSCADGDTKFGALFFILLFWFSFNVIGCDNAVGKFLYSFATESELDFSVHQAVVLNSLFWISFTFGRCLTSIVSRCVSARVLLFTEAVANVVCGVVLVVWGASQPLVLWVFVALLGVSLSPVIPTGIAWCNRYVVMNGVSMSLLFSGAAAGSMFFQWLTGFLFELYGPHALLYVILVYSGLLSVIVLLQQLLVRNRPDRFGGREVSSAADLADLELNVDDEHDHVTTFQSFNGIENGIKA